MLEQSGTLIQNLFLLFILLLPATFVPVYGQYIEATVYIDPTSHAASIKLGTMDKLKGTAYGFYNNTLNQTGWGILEVTAQSSAGENRDVMYAAGYLEGILTARQIHENFLNLKAGLGIDDSLKAKYVDFVNKQDKWMRARILSHPISEHVFWTHVSYVIAQFDGLYAGYKAASQPDWETDLFVLQLLNGIGDFLDLQHVLMPGKRPDFFRMTKEQLQLYSASNGHCSALVKVTPGFEDILMSHSSWFLYSATMRIYKHYHLYVNDKNTASFSLSFSSYPGFLESLDDFYILSNNLVMLQTTILVYNTSLYRSVTPQSLFAWQRVRVANMLAHDGYEWYSVFSRYNSGTYNNQYMVIDLNRVELNKHLGDGALWVVEQIPGLVVGTDQTAVLRAGYWASYNVPFHELVYNVSGTADVAAKHGPDFSFELAPRAKIFRRDQASVMNLTSLQNIMRYNDYEHDRYSESNPCNTICCRGDLSTSPRPVGCYDTKVTNYRLAGEMASSIINGPTTSHNLKPFSWSGQFAKEAHFGLPETYDFDWVSARPQLV